MQLPQPQPQLLRRPSAPAGCPGSRPLTRRRLVARQAPEARTLQRAAVVPAPSGAPLARSTGSKVFVPFRPEFFSTLPVQLAGSWNDWALNVTLPHNEVTGETGAALELDAEQTDVAFKFNVAGKWLLSRADTAAADAQGCINNTTAGRSVHHFTFPATFAPPGTKQEVLLVGSFTGWQVAIPMALGADGAYHARVALPPGHHTYRFVLPQGGAGGGGGGGPAGAEQHMWAVLEDQPRETLPGGVLANALTVAPPVGFRILYHTDFSEAYLTYRFRGDADPGFRRLRMHHFPDAPGLMVGSVPAASPGDVLEFTISGARREPGSLGTIGTLEEELNAAGSSSDGGSSDGEFWTPNRGSIASTSGLVRDPPGSGLHVAEGTGTWRLKDGSLELDVASQLPPLMLCTDLDGTLIEDGEDGDWVASNDAATARAGRYFNTYLGPAGGVLVYNTGRSIGMVEGLLCKKAGVMPIPAACITAVGTKVFLFDVATRRWVADPAYSHLLDEGWDLAAVQRAAHRMMGRFPGAASIVDDGSEHPHRMSLSIKAHVLDEFLTGWSRGLSEAGVEHQMVASIGGEWRYVDCIAKNAGKGSAMAYLAARFGIAIQDVVAAGDSGNDLLMLGPLPQHGCHPAIIMSNSHPEVWDWLAGLSPEERKWVYTPRPERADGLVEGMANILADKLRDAAARKAAAALRPPKPQRQAHKQLPHAGSAYSPSSASSSSSSSQVPPQLRALRG